MIESHAFAMAVFEISAALKDCVGAAPQADIRVMMNMERMVRYFFFIFSPCTYFYHKRSRFRQMHLQPLFIIRLVNLIFLK